MMIFKNPGQFDMLAATTLGVSVKTAGSFGRFGTGFKFSIATILRAGGSVGIMVGADQIVLFDKAATVIRGEPFDLVTMDGTPLGFTTMLGRDWEAWQVLRELGCNATDEGGTFWHVDSAADVLPSDFAEAGHTVVVVDWPELDAAFLGADNPFVKGEPLWENDRLRVLPGPSAFLYYRGVRVHKLNKPSVHTYDLTADQVLTEDRTLLTDYTAQQDIRRALLAMDDPELIRPALLAGEGHDEHRLAFSPDYDPDPSRAFLTVVAEAREKRSGNLNPAAKKVLLKSMRKVDDEHSGGGWSRPAHDDGLQFVFERLDGMGVSFSDTPFIRVPELPAGVATMCEGGKVFYIPQLLELSPRGMALQLLARWVDLSDLYSPEQVAERMGKLLLDGNEKWRAMETEWREYVEANPGMGAKLKPDTLADLLAQEAELEQPSPAPASVDGVLVDDQVAF